METVKDKKEGTREQIEVDKRGSKELTASKNE